MSGPWAELVAAAKAARAHAYAPYSKFHVGAALHSVEGTLYLGCNVENASYGATVCAERVALFKMIAAGERRFDAIAIYTEADPPAMPCGLCRQVLGEFSEDATVVVASPLSSEALRLSELLPRPFLLK